MRYAPWECQPDADGRCQTCGKPIAAGVARDCRKLRNRRPTLPVSTPAALTPREARRQIRQQRRNHAAAIVARLRACPRHDGQRPLEQCEAAAVRLATAGTLDGQTCSKSLWAIVRDLLAPDRWRPEWGDPPKVPTTLPPSPLPRIVHVMPWHLLTGGAQRMLDLWCQADAHRWDVHVVTSGLRGPWRMAGATVHAEVQPRDYPALMASLAPDVVVHHNQAAPDMRADGWPQVWIVHGMPQMRRPPTPGAKPDSVIVNLASDELDPGWRSLPVHVIPLGVDLQAYRPRPDDGTVRPGPDGQPVHRAPVLGFVGRLHGEKFPESFARAMAAWDPGSWRLRMIGHGWDSGHQARVRAILAGCPWVEWVGDVAPDAIPEALAGLDAVIVSTDMARGETGCYSAVEAMACGLPVVARDVPGLRQSCRDGAVYGADDAELLAAVRTLDDATVRAEIGRRARQVAEDIHDLRIWANAHSALYSAAMRREVSILMPVYQTPARMLLEAWESIQAQTFRRWELVLVDDGSTDPETIAAVDRIAADPRVRLGRLADNHGISIALNIGLEACRCDLVARMDADDVMATERLARQVAYMRSHPAVTILGAQIEIFRDGTGEVLSRTRHPAVVTDSHVEAQRRAGNIWYLNHPTVIYRREAIQAIGGYDPQWRRAQDLDLWERCRRAGLVMHNLPEVLVRYRLHPGQDTFGGANRPEHDAIVRG